MICQWSQAFSQPSLRVAVAEEEIQADEEDQAEEYRVLDDDARLRNRVSPSTDFCFPFYQPTTWRMHTRVYQK